MARDSDYAFSATFWMAVTTLIGLVIVARINAKKTRDWILSDIQNSGQPPDDPMDYDRERSTSEGRRDQDQLRREIFGRTEEEFRQYCLERQAADPYWEVDEDRNSRFAQWNMRMAEDYPLIERRGGVDRRDVVVLELQPTDLRYVTRFRAGLSGDDAKVSITQWAEVHSTMMEAMENQSDLYQRPDILTTVITRLGELTTATYMKYRMAILAYVRWLFRTYIVVNAGRAVTHPSMPNAAMRVTDPLSNVALDLMDLDVHNPDNVPVFTDFLQTYEERTGPGRARGGGS